jgi:hypothetical protein
LAPTKDLIFISCFGRSKTALGSSKFWSNTSKGVGILSDEGKKKKFHLKQKISLIFFFPI